MLCLQQRFLKHMVILPFVIATFSPFHVVAQSSPNPVYVIVGGVSHTEVFFNDLMSALQIAGYDSRFVELPTVGDPQDTIGKNIDDEVTAIQNDIASVINEGRDVILLCHSRGGLPGSRAVPGWDKPTREARGQENGVVEMVYLAAFLLQENADIVKFSAMPPWLNVEVSAAE